MEFRADQMTVERVRGLSAGILQSFKFGNIPPLESLAALLAAYESLFKNLMEKSAKGQWQHNKDGLLIPLDKMVERLKALEEPSPIIMPPDVGKIQ